MTRSASHRLYQLYPPGHTTRTKKGGWAIYRMHERLWYQECWGARFPMHPAGYTSGVTDGFSFVRDYEWAEMVYYGEDI